MKENRKQIIEEKKKIITSLMKETYYVPMKEKELAIFLQVEKEDRPLLTEVLQSLIADGVIEMSKRGKYMLAAKKTKTGIFRSTPVSYTHLRAHET